jgi:ABC-type dipeptide/oligopeptide/nickel transport system permease subunit
MATSDLSPLTVFEPDEELDTPIQGPRQTPARIFWYRFNRNKPAILGAVIIVVMVLAALLAPLIAPYDPNFQDLNSITLPPTKAHLMGTDDLGRDVLSRIIF